MMDNEGDRSARDDTREKLLAAAYSQFADRGFYGASIAQIAGEIGLTKQALLYHFKRKEDIYSAVLKRIAVRMLAGLRSGVDASKSPEHQFENMIKGIYFAARDNPLDTKVLMRELLDDHRRDAPSSEWFFKTFLDELMSVLDDVPALSHLSFSEKFSRAYMLISAIQYFAASASVLIRFYGEEDYAQISQQYPQALSEQVKRLLQDRDV